MSKYESLAKEIVKNIGGKENISGLTHCITRLRFKLKDESKANDEVLKNMDGVVTVMHSAGQYQVVIGNHVPYVYEDVCNIAGIFSDKENEDTAPKGFFNNLIDIISGCFQPFLGALCAAGMIKGLNALLLFLGLYTQKDGGYILLNSIGDAIFYFMPIIIGYTSAKKFKLNPFVGMAIGAALCYPGIQKSTLSAGEPIMTLFAGTFAESPVYTKIFGIPLLAQNYTSSVVPVIFIVWIASKLQKLAKKFIPEVIQNFFVPLFVLIIALPLGFLIVGPMVSIATKLVGVGFSILYNFSPIICGILVGFFWQVLVIFGLHWGLIPLAMMNLGTLGYDTILNGMFGASFAQTAVIFAMYFKLKNKKEKELCMPAVISGIFGVTEPAIYGLSLPKKTPFIYSMIAGAVGGAVMGVMNVKAYTMGGLGIFGVVNYINPSNNDASGMFASFVCILVSMIVGFILTFFFWKDSSSTGEENINKSGSIKVEKEIIKAPLTGNIKSLSEVKDDAFAHGALGKGLAIEPKEGKVVAPFDGMVMALFPSKHAIGLLSDNGMEILIHIGHNTVQLEGKYFETHVNQGDKVKQGQTLITFDIDAIKKEGFNLETPVVVTNTSDYLDFIETEKKIVRINDDLFTVLN